MTLIPLSSRHVFLDESGDPSLQIDRAGVSNFLVITAVIVDTKNLRNIEAKARKVITKFFPNGEMKSSSIGKNQTRRLQILKEVATLDFKHYSQVIDKSEIITDSGLRFKKSFIKFIHRVVYQRLFKVFTDLHIIGIRKGVRS